MNLLNILPAAVGLALTGCELMPSSLMPSDASLVDELQGVQSQLVRLSDRLAALERTGPDPQGLTQPGNLLNRVLDTTALPGRGRENAPLALIEITDYQCPFCRRHHREVLADLQAGLVDTGMVRYLVFDYPLPGHPLAPQAAIAARCAGRQGRYWDFHDALFELELLTAADIDLVAIELGLELQAFGSCQLDPAHTALLDRQRSLAEGLGVRGTPTFLIGRLDPDGIVRDLTRLAGLQTVEVLHDRVMAYLAN